MSRLMVSYYPVVLFPPLLLEFLASHPERVKPCNLTKPIPPVLPQNPPPPLKAQWVLLAGILSLGTVLAAHVFVGLSPAALILGIISSLAIAIALLCYSYCAAYFYRVRYKRKLATYQQRKQEYLHNLKSTERTTAAVMRQQRGRKGERQKQLFALLDGKVRQPMGESTAQPGVSEGFFFKVLKHYFPDVTQGLTFAIPGSQYSYSSDFSLIDAATGLAIDIEVDEPYEGRTKQPHHCLDQGKDQQRNQFFLAGNWVVIRFAEEQVVKHPRSCAGVIAQVLAQLTGDYDYLEALQDVEQLPPVKQWTVTEARRMAKWNFRERYLAETGTFVAPPPKRKKRKKKQRRHR